MRKGELGPVMYIILGVLVLLAIIAVVVSMRDQSLGVLDKLRGLLR